MSEIFGYLSIFFYFWGLCKLWAKRAHFLFYKEKQNMSTGMQLAPDIEADVVALCNQRGFIPLRIHVSGTKRPVVEVIVDGPEGITLDACGEISSALGAYFEARNVFEGAYRLDVSSPGVNWPLEHEWQYRRNVGRILKITTTEGETLRARLESIDGDTLTLRQDTPAQKGRVTKPKDDDIFTLPLALVEKATVVVEF